MQKEYLDSELMKCNFDEELKKQVYDVKSIKEQFLNKNKVEII